MLTKFSQTDHFVSQFAERIHRNLSLSVDLLYVIQAYSEVPLKKDGTIVDNCTEVDLSGLYEQQVADKERMAQLDHDFFNKREVLIGDLEEVVAHKLDSENYDALFMGAHPTSFLEDLISDTTLERIIKSANIPVLSLKCNRSHDHAIERIGLFDDFNGRHVDVKEVKRIADAFNATVLLYKIMHKEEDGSKEEIEKRMLAFAEFNKLSKYECHILDQHMRDEDQLTVHMIEDDLHMIAVSSLHSSRKNHLIAKDLKTSVANHVFAPLLIY